MKNTRIVSALAAVAVAGIMLSGCSAVTAVANAQTKVQACSKIKGSFTTVGNTLTAQSAKLTTDPKGASAKIGTAAAKFSKDADSLSNAQVKKAAQGAAAQLTKFSKDVSAIETNPTSASTTKLQGDLAPLQTAFTNVSKVCKL